MTTTAPAIRSSAIWSRLARMMADCSAARRPASRRIRRTDGPVARERESRPPKSVSSETNPVSDHRHHRCHGEAQSSDVWHASHDIRVRRDAFVGHVFMLTAADVSGMIHEPAQTEGPSRPAAEARTPVHKSVSKLYVGGRFLIRNQPLALVAGAGFEPATSGLWAIRRVSLPSRAVSRGCGYLGGQDISHRAPSAPSRSSRAVSPRPVYKPVYRTGS